MHSIKVKLLVWYMIIQAIVLASFNYALYIDVEHNLRENFYSVMQTHEAIEHFLTAMWILTPFILVFSSAGGYFLMKKYFEPIKNILHNIHAIHANDLSVRLKERPCEEEINELIQAFNAMLKRLEDSFHAIRAFNSDVSHELRTPLTIMRGSIEVALRKKRENEAYEVILKDQLVEIQTLQERIETLLELAETKSLHLPQMHQRFKETTLLS